MYLISNFQVGLKSLLRQGLSEADFYGDLVYKLKKIVGSACLVVNPIMLSSLIASPWVGLQTL